MEVHVYNDEDFDITYPNFEKVFMETNYFPCIDEFLMDYKDDPVSYIVVGKHSNIDDNGKLIVSFFISKFEKNVYDKEGKWIGIIKDNSKYLSINGMSQGYVNNSIIYNNEDEPIFTIIGSTLYDINENEYGYIK